MHTHSTHCMRIILKTRFQFPHWVKMFCFQRLSQYSHLFTFSGLKWNKLVLDFELLASCRLSFRQVSQPVSRELYYLAETISSFRVAGVASVSVWFRSKKRPWKGIFGFDFARNETKTENSFPRPFFAPKPNWNACYAGHSEWRDCLSQVAQVPGLAETKADVKRVTRAKSRTF